MNLSELLPTGSGGGGGSLGSQTLVYEEFLADGTFTPPANIIGKTIGLMLIGGGGPGGYGNSTTTTSGGAGGGAGQVLLRPFTVPDGSPINVTIGEGGIATTVDNNTQPPNGSPSMFGAITALGGGNGAALTRGGTQIGAAYSGKDIGCGGGAANISGTGYATGAGGGNGGNGQDFPGTVSTYTTGRGLISRGGHSSSATSSLGLSPGQGVPHPITGRMVGGGGGGYTSSSTVVVFGLGGGGSGGRSSLAGTSGEANTGGGGGGGGSGNSTYAVGGNGGSGYCLVWWYE